KQAPERPPRAGEKGDKEKHVDTALVVKLQKKVKELEKERQRLLRELERKSDSTETSQESSSDGIYETIKIQELEMENSHLKKDLANMRESIAKSGLFEQGTKAVRE
ncbi:unnamed protein product, partial [Owenia fusiformis]